MEEFKAIHGELYNLQSFCGFWPFPESRNIFLQLVKRYVINSITIACIVIQSNIPEFEKLHAQLLPETLRTRYSTLRNVELTLDNVLSTLSFSGPMLLFFVRYVSYLLALKTMRRVFQSMENDFAKWKNTDEMKLFEEEIKQAKLIYHHYTRLVVFTVVGLYLAFIPIITQPTHQVAYLRYFGFYFTKQSIKTTLVCFQIMFVFGIGIFCILGTEASLSVICHHVCGLLKITGVGNRENALFWLDEMRSSISKSNIYKCVVHYKVTMAINDAAKSTTVKTVNIAPAIKLHLKAIELVSLYRHLDGALVAYLINALLNVSFILHMDIVRERVDTLWIRHRSMIDSISQDLGLSYVVTIGTAIVSFSLNLYRIFMAIMQRSLDETVAPSLIIIAHIIMLFLGNHCGQRVSNTSLELFNAAYSSEWYNIPPNERKLVTFIMLKSSRELVICLLSLYTASYEGYSMIMRTAFSYFTVLLSVQ